MRRVFKGLGQIGEFITLIPAMLIMIWWIKPWRKTKDEENGFNESGLDERE